jgi:hypothetical protein
MPLSHLDLRLERLPFVVQHWGQVSFPWHLLQEELS